MELLKCCVSLVVIILVTNLHYSLSLSQNECNDPQIIHKFTVIDYDWSSDAAREDAIESEEYIPNNNIISGMKVYGDDVYVTVPRWRLGVPATLNKIAVKNGTSVLQAFPSWDMQELGNCHALQYVEGMEIDPNTGWMWIIDTGRINFLSTDGTETENLCPAKIVVYDINTMEEVTRHEFPNEVVNHKTNFLNDIVIQYSDNEPRFAYISDTFDFRLVVYDRIQNVSHYHSHPSMLPEPGNGNITILGEIFEVAAGINGIAMSHDMQYLYYAPVSGYALYQIPTSVTSIPGSDFAGSVRKVGNRPSQTAGMTYSRKNFLYFASLAENAIYRWNIEYDQSLQGLDNFNDVEMRTLTNFMSDDKCINFVDIFNFDTEGFLWFSVNKLHKFHLNSMDFTGSSGANVLIWKIHVGDAGYLDRREETTPNVIETTTGGA
ncbi:major royal jelly protein 1-like [Mizuhopecten yessoensis]|uniref:Major royal jelly protein 1 n=1 Tax=Mizuhopecten yessoensis TaxID=6573 RepID=A0A210Q9K1_MIZYE|nr:major royal jelly protein 1-like [Mizuhopecten yessoensis]OWF45422.1 Major royal jelly protein 1 [Mizuhopecten yessoensis]